MRHIPGAIGADEVGRGPLAGPVVAAAVMLPEDFDLTDVRDSKALSPEVRQRVAARICAVCRFRVVEVSPAEVDRLNILWASMEAMRAAICAFGCESAQVFVDGNRIPSGIVNPSEALVKGDSKIACIAAASIVAKVYRDKLMADASQIYPGYGFERHFGYPTPEHLVALKSLGPCPLHRRSFGPVREVLQQLGLWQSA